MLIEKRLHGPIRDGRVTVLLRRWKAPQASNGGVYRTAAGRIAVDEICRIEPADVTQEDAERAGHADPVEALSYLRGTPETPLFLLRIRFLDEPDPRTALAADDRLSEADVAAIARRLDRLDRASAHGPWTRHYLELVAQHPERRAPDLAEMVGRETQPFKTDVRKLKNLGLTISHRIGYTLSPRGAAFLAATRHSWPATGPEPRPPTRSAPHPPP